MRILDHITRGLKLLASVSLLTALLVLVASAEARADRGGASNVTGQQTPLPGSSASDLRNPDQPPGQANTGATAPQPDQPGTASAQTGSPGEQASSPAAQASTPAAQASTPAAQASTPADQARSFSDQASAPTTQTDDAPSPPGPPSQTSANAGNADSTSGQGATSANSIASPIASQTPPVAQSNTTTQAIFQVQNLGCSAGCQDSTQAQSAGQQDTTVDLLPTEPSAPPGSSTQYPASPTSNITQLQLGCLSRCFGTSTVTSDTQQALQAVDRLLSGSGMPTLPSQTPVPAAEQNVVTQTASQSQDGGGAAGGQAQEAQQTNSTLQASTPFPSLTNLVPVTTPSSSAAASVAGDTSSSLGQLKTALSAVSAAARQFEISLGLLGSASSAPSLDQQPADPLTSSAASPTSGPGSATRPGGSPSGAPEIDSAGSPATSFAQVVNQVEQGIWQIQIGCLIFCSGTQQSQQATQSERTIFVVPNPSASSTQTVTAITTSYQFIWQLQVGCVFWCYDAVESQTAGSTATVLTESPAPPSPTSDTGGGIPGTSLTSDTGGGITGTSPTPDTDGGTPGPSPTPDTDAGNAGPSPTPDTDEGAPPATTSDVPPAANAPSAGASAPPAPPATDGAPSIVSPMITSPPRTTASSPTQHLTASPPPDLTGHRSGVALVPIPVVGSSLLTASIAPPARSTETPASRAPGSRKGLGFVPPVEASYAPAFKPSVATKAAARLPHRRRRHTAQVGSLAVIGGNRLSGRPDASASSNDDTTIALLGFGGLIALLSAGGLLYRRHQLPKT